MPALYAHNKFGKLVIKTLPEHLLEIIKKYPNSFRIGLQGPDTLFFFNPIFKNKINQLGRTIHRADAYTFFENSLSILSAQGYNSSCHAYILGFICHYALDKKCHPYVTNFMKTTGCGHSEIEGDFEHYLISIDGGIPHKYRLYKLVPTNLDTANSISPFYPELSLKNIHNAMRHMRFTKRLFFAPHILKRTIIDTLMRSTFNYKFFKGHMIFPNANKKCRPCIAKLYMEFMNTVPFARDMIEEFEESLLKGIPLSDNFHGDFYGI